MTEYTTDRQRTRNALHDPTRPETIRDDLRRAQDDVKASELLTVGQAAQAAGVFTSRIQNAMSSGRLPYVTVGASRYRFVTRADLETWAEQLKGR